MQPSAIVQGLSLSVIFSALSFVAQAQTPAAPAAVNTIGVVTKIDANARRITLKTDAGAEVPVTVQANAGFRKVAPGETDLRNAITITIADINAGDRVLARGRASADQAGFAATLVVVMSQSDIANKQAQEKADWDHRGVVGVVTAVAADQITISVRGAGAGRSIEVVPADAAVVRRYAPDSVKFSEAKPSKLADIKAGDQVRARGDKSGDGARMTADEIVSGSFHTIAAIVNSVDADQGLLRVTNLDGKKPLVVKVNSDSGLHRLAPEMARMLAARNRPPEGGAVRANPTADGGGRGSGRGGAEGRGGDLQQMIDRAPRITLADLKAGDAIVVSSTEGSTPNQIMAITLVSGVEPILTAPGRKEMALGSWSLDMEGGGGQ
jgi:Cu/Ag efflux protein CusF